MTDQCHDSEDDAQHNEYDEKFVQVIGPLRNGDSDGCGHYNCLRIKILAPLRLFSISVGRHIDSPRQTSNYSNADLWQFESRLHRRTRVKTSSQSRHRKRSMTDLDLSALRPEKIRFRSHL